MRNNNIQMLYEGKTELERKRNLCVVLLMCVAFWVTLISNIL